MWPRPPESLWAAGVDQSQGDVVDKWMRRSVPHGINSLNYFIQTPRWARPRWRLSSPTGAVPLLSLGSEGDRSCWEYYT